MKPIALTLACSLAFFSTKAQELPELSLCIGNPLQLSGDTLLLEGDFDGNSWNTTLWINGTEHAPVAETNQFLQFVTGPQPAGESYWELTDGEAQCSGITRFITVSGSVDKANLVRGERTLLRLRVGGLDGYPWPVRLSVANHSPEIIALEGGNAQVWTIRPGEEPHREWQVTGIRRGDFDIRIDLMDNALQEPEMADNDNPDSEEGPAGETEKPAPEADAAQPLPVAGTDEGASAQAGDSATGCGSVYGKVENLIGQSIRHIVVFIDGECSLCPPSKQVDSIGFTNNCYKYEPSWGVVPAGGKITVKNTATIDCDIGVMTSKDANGNRMIDQTISRGESYTATASNFWESPSGVPLDYLLNDQFHKRVDASIFIAPNPCYAQVDAEGNYSIGELHPGTYTLRVYTKLQRSHTPVATVTIKPGERVRQDFTIRRDQPRPAKPAAAR